MSFQMSSQNRMGIAEFRTPSLSTSVGRLLRLRLAILISDFRRSKIWQKIGMIVFMILAAGLLVGVLALSILFLNFIRSPQLGQYIGNTMPFLESIPTMLLSVSALAILITSAGVLLQGLYLSNDMDFLMSSPVPIRAVFIAKMVQAVLPNFLLLCLLVLPVLFGLGISSGYNLLYYPFVIILLITISLAAASLASLLVLVVAHFFQPRRVAEVLGFVIGISAFICSQSARLINYDSIGASNQQIGSLLGMTNRFNQPWSPMAWSGRGLIELGKNNWLPALAFLAASLLITSLIFYVALATSERLYYSGWSSLQNNRRKSKSRKAVPVPAAAEISLAQAEVKPKAPSPFSRLIPAPVSAIIQKDLILYRRDLRNLSQLLTPLILGIVYAISLLRSGGEFPMGRGQAPDALMKAANTMLVYADIGLALFLGWMLVANIAGTGFSREGKSYWMVKAAPIGSRQLLTAKFLVSYLPCAIVCSTYVLVLEILKHASPWSIIISLVGIWLMVAGLNGIYLAVGTRGARFDWENPQQMNRGVGCVGVLISILFVPIDFFLFVTPVFVAQLLNLPVTLGQITGLLLGGVVSILAVIIPLGMVENRVATLNE